MHGEYQIDHVPFAAGDIADGYKVYESLLNQYYDQMSVITSEKPYMVGPGNHEANCKIHP